MGEASKIQWCEHTFNGWLGCDNVGPGCDHCYAEAWAKRTGLVGWGPDAPRRRTTAGYWQKPYKWNAEACLAGRPARVFCNSLADVFDNKVPAVWREDLFELIKATPWLFWMLLTKRIGNAQKMLPEDWGDGYKNVMIMATMVNQNEVDRDMHKLVDVPARYRGVSIEPMLGPIDLHASWHRRRRDQTYPAIDLIICGGEGGPGARDFDLNWAEFLMAQCDRAAIAFFMKQLGRRPHQGRFFYKLEHDRHHGGDMSEFPKGLRRRAFPRIAAP